MTSVLHPNCPPYHPDGKIISLQGYLLYFRTSKMGYMNDPGEYLFFIQNLRQTFAEYEIRSGKESKLKILDTFFNHNEIRDSYVLSLSKLEDSLTAWRAYGENGKGVAIGFDKALLTSFCKSLLGSSFDKYKREYGRTMQRPVS